MKCPARYLCYSRHRLRPAGGWPPNSLSAAGDTHCS